MDGGREEAALCDWLAGERPTENEACTAASHHHTTNCSKTTLLQIYFAGSALRFVGRTGLPCKGRSLGNPSSYSVRKNLVSLQSNLVSTLAIVLAKPSIINCSGSWSWSNDTPLLLKSQAKGDGS
eukprot:scaffold3217_cov221-Alexandrium_tamarense.AAC.9